MKNIFTGILILTMGIVWSQEFYFDRLIQYAENDDTKIQVLYNTENADYYLYLNDGPSGIYADLIDKNTNKIHHFTVTKPQQSNGLIYTYVFDSTEKLLEETTGKHLSYEFQTKRDDKYYRFADLNIFETEKKINNLVSADLTMRYNHENKFNVFNLCCLLGANYTNAIQPEEKFVVVEAKITDHSGNLHKYKLISDQLVQFTLKVPSKKKKEVIKLRRM